MSDIPFMQFYPGDYVQKTANLTTEQHGAYLLMLFAAWGKGGCKLPDNDQQLASIVRLNVRKWKAMRPIIMEFWDAADGFISNERQVSDYQKATEKRARRAAAGARGGEAKSLKSNAINHSNATILPAQCSSKLEPEPEPERKKARDARDSMADDYVDAKKRIGLDDFPNKKHLDYIEGLRADFEISTDTATIVEQFTANKVKNGTMVVGLAGDLRLWILRQRDIERRKPSSNGVDTRPEWAVKRDEQQTKVKIAMQKMREEEENGHAN